MTRTLSCHCRRIVLDVEAELDELMECNCSTCGRTGFLHWKVPARAIRQRSESIGTATYAWRSAAEGQTFCPVCGVHLMRSGYPNGDVSLNARCLEGVDVFALEVSRFDGRHEIPPGPRD